MLYRVSVAVALLCQACATASSGIEPGGCVLVKQTSTGEYPIAQLTKMGDDQGVCDHVAEQWSQDAYMSGTSSRFRCQCPNP
jgi:hypothetical protein